jgi:ribose transport system permease protein
MADAQGMTVSAPPDAAAPARASAEWQTWAIDRGPFLIACAMLAALLGVYATLQRDVFSLEELNLDATASMALLLAATGQTIVLLRGGIDLSVGGMISLGTVLAATQFGDSFVSASIWAVLIVAIGAFAGAVNGLLISVLKLQPFLVTLATWSILGGAALMILPTDGGRLPAAWMTFGNSSLFGLSTSVWLLAALFLFWLWFRDTPLGVVIRATGSSEKSAFLSGVSPTFVNVAAYGLSGGFAALSALYLTTQTGTGSPTVGNGFILPTVAAAVIGGISLFGGRGGLAGTIVGAFILTIIGNLVFVLDISSYWQPIASGAILLLAVLASSIADKSARRGIA